MDAIVRVAELNGLQQLIDYFLCQLFGHTASNFSNTSPHFSSFFIYSFSSIAVCSHPLLCFSISFSSVRSQYSNTKCNFLFLLNTSIKFTKFGCFSCWKNNALMLENKSCQYRQEGQYWRKATPIVSIRTCICFAHNKLHPPISQSIVCKVFSKSSVWRLCDMSCKAAIVLLCARQSVRMFRKRAHISIPEPRLLYIQTCCLT